MWTKLLFTAARIGGSAWVLPRAWRRMGASIVRGIGLVMHYSPDMVLLSRGDGGEAVSHGPVDEQPAQSALICVKQWEGVLCNLAL